MNKPIILSIHHKWAELIYEGKKTVELRKTRPNQEPPFIAFLYDTQLKRITGRVKISAIAKYDGIITEQMRNAAQITLDDFLDYANKGNGKVFFWHIEEVGHLYPQGYITIDRLLGLGIKRAPQSWMYIEPFGKPEE